MSDRVYQERTEIRAQRHDFLKEYYKMAAADLDRHLKGGWQTITVLAGGAAALSLGHDEKIVLPIATAIAIAIAWWGALSTLDANYWSVRAIAFLANIEAVYFSVEDRRYTNPYAGLHPQYKLMNSLRYNFYLFLLFGVLCISDLMAEVWLSYPSLQAIWAQLQQMSAPKICIWSIPELVFVWGLVWIMQVWRKRFKDYDDFNRQSPGPPMRAKTGHMRHVDLSSISGEQPPPERARGGEQASFQAPRRRSRRATVGLLGLFILAILVSCGLGALLIHRMV